MFTLSAIATQPVAAPKGRTVVARAKSGNAMTFDLPRGR
jgi:hypothetical protein